MYVKVKYYFNIMIIIVIIILIIVKFFMEIFVINDLEREWFIFEIDYYIIYWWVKEIK